MTIDIKPIETWPGKMREPSERQISRFTSTWSQTKKLLEREAAMIGVRSGIVVQVGIDPSDFRLDGELRAKASFEHPGVVVSLGQSKHGLMSMPCDAYRDNHYSGYLLGWQANVRAVALTLSSLRDISRYGVGTGSEQYTGWTALPPGRPMPAPADAWTPETAAKFLMTSAGVTTGWTQAASGVEETVVLFYRAAMKKAHPDATGEEGDGALIARIQSARDFLLRFPHHNPTTRRT